MIFIILDQLEDLIVSENRMTAFELLKSYPEFQYTSLKKQYKNYLTYYFYLKTKVLIQSGLRLLEIILRQDHLKI